MKKGEKGEKNDDNREDDEEGRDGEDNEGTGAGELRRERGEVASVTQELPEPKKNILHKQKNQKGIIFPPHSAGTTLDSVTKTLAGNRVHFPNETNPSGEYLQKGTLLFSFSLGLLPLLVMA